MLTAVIPNSYGFYLLPQRTTKMPTFNNISHIMPAKWIIYRGVSIRGSHPRGSRGVPPGRAGSAVRGGARRPSVRAERPSERHVRVCAARLLPAARPVDTARHHSENSCRRDPFPAHRRALWTHPGAGAAPRRVLVVPAGWAGHMHVLVAGASAARRPPQHRLLPGPEAARGRLRGERATSRWVSAADAPAPVY